MEEQSAQQSMLKSDEGEHHSANEVLQENQDTAED